MTELLTAANLSVHYGGVRALDDVTVSVPRNQIVGLIGPNGAGKTTLVDAITGFIPHASGTVTFDGHDLTQLPAHRRSRAGIARTWQSAELFDDLSVRENLEVGRDWHHHDRPAQPLEELAARLSLDTALERPAGDLSQGQRKLAGVARALASAPLLVCLDEPAAGLNATESRRLGEQLRTIAHDGTSILLIDHDIRLVLDICDDIYVLKFGTLLAHGTPATIRLDDDVREAYLGSHA